MKQSITILLVIFNSVLVAQTSVELIFDGGFENSANCEFLGNRFSNNFTNFNNALIYTDTCSDNIYRCDTSEFNCFSGSSSGNYNLNSMSFS